MGRKLIDYTGQRHFNLVAIERVEINFNKVWKCQCDCGNIAFIKNFKNNKSCGCLGKTPDKKPIFKSYDKNCEYCGGLFTSSSKTVRFCSESCASKMKFVNHPELREISRENGRKVMKMLHETGQAYIMPVGTHTQKFKDELSARSKIPKTPETKEKIRKNHWSRNLEIRQQTIDKIDESRKNSEKWNSDERRNSLANLMMESPELVTHHSFYKVGHFLNTTTNEMEYHHSGFEQRFMEFLNNRKDIKMWTKKHKIFINYTINEKIKKYWPDFFIEFSNGFKTLVELKGFKEEPQILEAKIQAGIEYCKVNNLVYQIIFQTENDNFSHIRSC